MDIAGFPSDRASSIASSERPDWNAKRQGVNLQNPRRARVKREAEEEEEGALALRGLRADASRGQLGHLPRRLSLGQLPGKQERAVVRHDRKEAINQH